MTTIINYDFLAKCASVYHFDLLDGFGFTDIHDVQQVNPQNLPLVSSRDICGFEGVDIKRSTDVCPPLNGDFSAIIWSNF